MPTEAESVNSVLLLDGGQFSREFPHDIDIEQALLGALLVKNERLDSVRDFLSDKHFFEPLHQEIYRLICKLVDNRRAATPLTLKSYFHNVPDISPGLGVPKYLVRLVTTAPGLARVKDYGETIRDLAKRRFMIDLANDVVEQAQDTSDEVDFSAYIESVQRKMDVAVSGDGSEDIVSLKDAVSDVVKTMSDAYEQGGLQPGLGLPLTDLNRKLGGLVPGDLYVVAARPSMGKTALVTNIAYHVAHKLGLPVDFKSLEMTRDQLAGRILSEVSRVSSADIRSGHLSENEYNVVRRAQGIVERIPLFIDDVGNQSIEKLAARARRTKRRIGTKLLIIDYIQLMNGDSRNRVEDVRHITAGLKALAKELHVPILALSQLSRSVEHRDDKRPQLSDLRESGSIEQDADVVMFIYREEYYLERMKPDIGDKTYVDWQQRFSACAGQADIIIGKQRHGPLGTVKCHFNKQLTQFSDLARG